MLKGSSSALTRVLAPAAALIILLCGCFESAPPEPLSAQESRPGVSSVQPPESDQGTQSAQNHSSAPDVSDSQSILSAVVPYSGEPYTVLGDNVPQFSAEDQTDASYEQYAPLDSLGRCGTAQACIGTDLMPTEERGSIGSVKPSGWHTVKYDFVNGKYLYNRCHLIGFQLTGENANACNLITGTRYLNIEGMLPFENMVADYIKETGNHVLYRVTPVFDGDNLVASGVRMEAFSVEDNGDGICFDVYAYNVQPGVVIDYASGESRAADPPAGG